MLVGISRVVVVLVGRRAANSARAFSSSEMQRLYIKINKLTFAYVAYYTSRIYDIILQNVYPAKIYISQTSEPYVVYDGVHFTCAHGFYSICVQHFFFIIFFVARGFTHLHATARHDSVLFVAFRLSPIFELGEDDDDDDKI